MANFPDGTECVAKPLARGAAPGFVQVRSDQGQFTHRSERVPAQRCSGWVVVGNHQASRFRKVRIQCELLGHIVMKRPESEFPASFAYAIDDLPTRSDHNFEPRERIALAEFLKKSNTDARVCCRRHGQ